MKYKPETYYKAIEMRNKGYKLKEISEKLGVNYETLRGWFYHGKKPRGAEKREVKKYKTSYDQGVYYGVIKLWNQGLKLKEIKKRYPDIPWRTLKNWIQGIRKPYKAEKQRIRRRRKQYKYNTQEIIKDIISGRSAKEIAKKHKVSNYVIYEIKRRYRLVTPHVKNHYDFNKASELNDEEKAYIIGLIDDVGISIHANYHELKLITTHITYLGLLRQVFLKYPYHLRFSRRQKRYKGRMREMYEIEVRIAMPPYKYLVKRKKRRRWIKWVVENHFLEFLTGLIDADGSIIITKRGEYILMITNSKRYLINKVTEKLRELGLHPKIKYNKRSRCYQIQIRRKSEVKCLLKQLMLKHPEKVFLKYLVLSDKFSNGRKSEIYRKYRRHVKQRSQKWIEREYGISLLRYYPPLPLLYTPLKIYKLGRKY